MDIRPARPMDVPLVLSLAFAEDSHLIKDPNWPLAKPLPRSVARASLPLAISGRSWIAREGRNAALLEIEPRKYVIGWDITRLAVRGDGRELFAPLLSAALSEVQRRGVPRLFARCDPEATGELHALGFQHLAREYVLAGPPTVCGDAPLPAGSRYGAPQDAWPLHQLESGLTPAIVRQLEGLSSMDWTQRESRRSEIVVESGVEIVAWAAWTPKRRGFSPLGLLIHPAHQELGDSLLRHVLARLEEHRAVVRIREYQGQTLRLLEDAGFEVLGEDMFMVKHGRMEYVPRLASRAKVSHMPAIRAFTPVPLGHCENKDYQTCQ